jgi:ATP-dependent Clp protease ATP-binding subunit ClpB
MESHSVSKLIGSPPGYVGHDDGGQLTEQVRRKPYSIVLFDEIEKAHPDVFNLLLQIMDDGRLTDSHGRTVSFKNTIIIMTSNLKPELLRDTFRPEFLNRIDETVIFNSLGKDAIAAIVKLQLERVQRRLDDKKIKLNFDKSALDFLCEAGYDPDMGARPVKRAIQNYVENALAKELLSGKIAEGSVVNISSGATGLIIN